MVEVGVLVSWESTDTGETGYTGKKRNMNIEDVHVQARAQAYIEYA